MSDPCVVVIRTKSGDEIIAILTGKQDDQLRVDHPYYARFNFVTGNVTMVPYCPLSDEIHFSFITTDVQFVVTASEDISRKFLAMVNASEATQDEEEEDDETYLPSQVLSGNTTKH